jgi:hypothetical protein
MIHVCSLAKLPETAKEIGASHLITLLRDVDLIARPPSIARDNHLVIHVDDICCPIDGYTHPCEEHIGELVDFVRNWDRTAPCWCIVMPGSAARRRPLLPPPVRCIHSATKSRSHRHCGAHRQRLLRTH